MIDLGPHASYIIAAYCGVGVVTLGLIAAAAGNAQRQKARLKMLEAQGVRRRSADNKA